VSVDVLCVAPSVVCLSVCASVCEVLQKRLNRPRCRLGRKLTWAQDGDPDPTERENRGSIQAVCQSVAKYMQLCDVDVA